jgi:diacylglycerol kinase family enzyme
MDLPNQPWVAVIANPFSGAGENQKRVGELSRALGERGLITRVVWDRQEGQRLMEHPRLRDYCWCLVIAGGDGTVAGVVNYQVDVPIAVLPLGNENLLAKEFGYNDGEEALAEAIFRRHHSRFDLGRANGRLFTLMLSVGIDAEIVQRVQDWRARSSTMKRISHWSYVPRIVSGLMHYKYPQLTVIDDQGRETKGAFVVVMNLPRYGLNLQFIPDAKGDDGQLSYAVFEKPGSLMAVRYFLSVFTGRHLRRADVKFGKSTGLKVLSSEPAPIQVDGDPAGTTPCEVGIEPMKMRVILSK